MYVLDYKDGNEKPDLKDTGEIITYKLGAEFENNSTLIVKLSEIRITKFKVFLKK